MSVEKAKEQERRVTIQQNLSAMYRWHSIELKRAIYDESLAPGDRLNILRESWNKLCGNLSAMGKYSNNPSLLEVKAETGAAISALMAIDLLRSGPYKTDGGWQEINNHLYRKEPPQRRRRA